MPEYSQKQSGMHIALLILFSLQQWLPCYSIVDVQAYVRHPELAEARANRDFVLKQVCDAVSTISGAAQAAGTAAIHPYESAGELAAALNDFDVRSSMAWFLAS